MKLNSYRDKDKTHLRDMIEVGVIDGDWPKRFPPVLAEGLQLLLDDPLCKLAYRDEMLVVIYGGQTLWLLSCVGLRP